LKDNNDKGRDNSGRLIGYLSYIPILNVLPCIIGIIRTVNDRFVVFHAKQGLVLFAVWLLTIFIAFISQILSLLLWGIVLFLHGLGFYSVFKQKMFKLPVVSFFAEKISEIAIYRHLTGREPDQKKYII